MSNKPKKTERLTFRATEEEMQLIRREARKRGCKPTSFVREAMLAFIKKTPAA